MKGDGLLRKGYYYFGESGFLCKVFLTLAIISLIASIVFFYIGGWVLLLRPWAVGEPTYSIWCVFFLLLAIILFLINLSIHKICDDVSEILRKIEDKRIKKERRL